MTYRCLNDPGPIALSTHPRERLLATGPKQIVQGADRVIVKVWADSDVDSTRARIDDGEWTVLEPSCDAHWQSPLPGDRLSRGEHSLEVEARLTDSRLGRQRVGFMVDPTGRYTPVPEVRPVVTGTAFC